MLQKFHITSFKLRALKSKADKIDIVHAILRFYSPLHNFSPHILFKIFIQLIGLASGNADYVLKEHYS